jgi:hypothetical protein
VVFRSLVLQIPFQQLEVIHWMIASAMQIYLPSTLQVWRRALHVQLILTLQLQVIHGMIASAMQALTQKLFLMPMVCKQASTATANLAIMSAALSASSVKFAIL